MAWDDVGADEMRALAPHAFAGLHRVLQLSGAVPEAMADRCRAQVAAAWGGPTAPGAVTAVDQVDQVALQFVLDVSSISADQRTTFLGQLGADALTFAQVLYLEDYRVRLTAAWRQLFAVDAGAAPGASGGGPGEPPGPTDPGELWDALQQWWAAVARLDALDPVTTEIVRLRGARAHDCRLCKSLRSVRAAEGGADEALYDQIDAYEQSTLPGRHKVALRLTDAVLWCPTSYPGGLAGEVAERFSAAETVELILDVARNAANKIAVLFGADAPHVTDGVERYDLDERGEVVYLG